ncbi:response regulator transcription factor [Paenibacillus apiarius]|uniref:Heme response regulator HssR n=1 Tax=Paenibacillus apiarius TaxID=46240 RepID=A0ABT4DS40_9BACL|nr:response regulator transcription factor [Paenibacillus apiarius]MBN3523993.1 response regulator transcription factor [Paenibacillus apiarius]MCY9515514.1 response regulator transcription factor [Paenibacillus apiarius]MCY9518923.1 response regulator transcription factor [Paenibacillus apiarius]MCY9552031.1 response regulator transcription factor [Paenibacillus apiarius]MCY9557293.1 response regulator transcription factor [Paenibacillus apiarius]
MRTILVADDDEHILELIGLYLRNEGFHVLEARDGLEAIHLMDTNRVDLVILDIMMPCMDGWELCSELRRGYPDLPLLMVTANGEPGQKIKGFQLGTDDYITKPFDPMEIVMRVKALLRRYRIVYSQVVQLGQLRLDRSSYKVIRQEDDSTMTLPLKEFELLFKLACSPGQILTREQLIQEIWGMDYEGDDRTVDVHIKRLRERFSGYAESFNIVTARSLGYRLEVYHD